jgi:chemotaxis protein MotA
MDLATIIGTLLGFGLLVGSILVSGSLSAFIDVPSLLIVVGGTISATLMMERLENCVGALRVAKNALFHQGNDCVRAVQQLLELSSVARRGGLLALKTSEVSEPFLQKGVRLAMLGVEREEIRETLSAELVAMRQRHTRGQKLFKAMGATAPAMGMIGTLIGLVQMLQTLSSPSAIGPAMAIALLTTLYGAVIAFLVCNPIAEKLERRTAEETAYMTVVIDGIDSIVRGLHTAVIKDKLQARLAPKDRPESHDEAA